MPCSRIGDGTVTAIWKNGFMRGALASVGTFTGFGKDASDCGTHCGTVVTLLPWRKAYLSFLGWQDLQVPPILTGHGF